jgi:hypothetical protein
MAYVPIEEEPAKAEYDGPRSRPISPTNRFAGLATESMAMNIEGGDATRREQKTVWEALHGPDSDKWLASKESEIANLGSTKTWVETKRPPGRKAIGCKWVFKVKTDADENVVKYKLRLVAQGFSQVPGVDFEQTFSPVGRITSLRLLVTLGATHDLEIRQADVEGAPLIGRLHVELYMAYPEGMMPKTGFDELRLVGAHYGLKQSGDPVVQARKGSRGAGLSSARTSRTLRGCKRA